ncbi:hypothetical protein Tco_1065872 [Tanacetum coccineum]
MADVRRLSAHVVKLRDMPGGVDIVWVESFMGIHDFFCLPKWIGAEVQEEPHHDVRPTLQRLPFYCSPLVAADAVILDPTPKDLVASNPSAKCTRSAMAQSSGSTTRPNLFADDSGEESDDDDDACYEISLVTPIRSANGKGILTDVVATPFTGASRPWPSSGPASSFIDVSGDAIHRDFFHFSLGSYFATYPEGGIAGNCKFTREEWDDSHQPTLTVLTKEVFKDPSVCKTVVDQFPTPGEMVRIEALSFDQQTTKMSVLHCLMMSHGSELLAWYRILLQSHHEYVQSTDSRLKNCQEKLAGQTELESQAMGKERKKKIKSLLTDVLEHLHVEVARITVDLIQDTVLEIYEHAAESLSVILQLEPGKLARLVNVPASRDACVFPPLVNESIVTLASKSLELPSNTIPISSTATLQPNKEWVNAMFDGPDHEMTDRAADNVFVQDASHVVDDDVELALVGSEHVSSGPGDVVVAFSAGEKGDGSLPSSTADEKVAATIFGV